MLEEVPLRCHAPNVTTLLQYAHLDAVASRKRRSDTCIETYPARSVEPLLAMTLTSSLTKGKVSIGREVYAFSWTHDIIFLGNDDV